MTSERHIFLVGLSGSGKSTVGKILAKRLKCKFVDLDQVIEKRQKKTISEIFRIEGETFFRKMETKELLNIVRTSKKQTVVALGGGAFESAQNRKAIEAAGISAWLRTPISVLARRLKSQNDRPLLMGEKLQTALKKQLQKRKKRFSRSDIKISTANKTPLQVAAKLALTLKKKYGTI